MNKSMRLSEHFTLGEMCKTKYVTADGNIPSHVVIENLKRICGWLEGLRGRWNEPIVINSGYRSPEVNRLAGGVPSSNHVTGCAVDIRVGDQASFDRLDTDLKAALAASLRPLVSPSRPSLAAFPPLGATNPRPLLPIGLSYEYRHFVIDARYTFGLTEIFDKDEIDLDSKNLTFQLSLAYKFKLK